MPDDPMPTPKVALITGGTRGIGLGIATELAASGFHLALNGRRAPQEVAPTIKQLESSGAQVIYCPGNVSARADHDRILNEINGRFGRLDVLVNNAGVAPEERADILNATEESFDRLMAINLKGPYFLTQSVANWMIRQRQGGSASHDPVETSRDGAVPFRGCIINISSVSATVASVNRGDYCITKAAIAMATQLWAARLAEFAIDVYEVRPGVIATDMTGPVKEKYDALIAGGLTLEKRWGTPKDVGRAVAVLARGKLTYATGQVLIVDGGLTRQRL